MFSTLLKTSFRRPVQKRLHSEIKKDTPQLETTYNQREVIDRYEYKDPDDSLQFNSVFGISDANLYKI